MTYPYPVQMPPPQPLILVNNAMPSPNFGYNGYVNNGYPSAPIPITQPQPPLSILRSPPQLTKRRRSSASLDSSYFKRNATPGSVGGSVSSTELSPLQILSSPESPNIQPATSFAWMFDDRLDTDFASARYDRVYQNYLNYYEAAAAQYISRGGYRARLPAISISDEMGRQILDILDPINEYNLSFDSFAYYIDVVWSSVEAVNVFIHRSTFYCDLQTPQLLSSMVVLGMSISQDLSVVHLAKILYMKVFDAVKTALAEERTSPSITNIGGRDVTPTFGKDISLLQAVCILIRFESHIIGGDKIDESRSISNGKWLIERYLWALIPKITALGNHPQSSNFDINSSNRSSPVDRNRTIHFVYGELNRKGYRLFENVDPVLQWQEWAKYEACKRAAHFALYCDCVHTLGRGNSSYQLSIFDIDTHMPCPECFWSATCYEEFYAIVGTQRFIRNVPYLYVVKSMLRFPRLGEDEDDSPCNTSSTNHPWSLFTLSTVIYGLLSTARAMNGNNSSPEEVLKRLKANGPNGSWLVDFFDRGVQVRLSRGLDMWAKYFEAASGNSKNQYPFQVFDNKFDNINIIGKVHVQSNSPIFIDFVLLIILNYHAAKILMCEEVKKIAVIATDIFEWIQHDPSPIIGHFPTDEYGYWARSDETRDMVSTACVYLVRATAGQRLLNRDRAENLFLGVVTYYSVLMIWLYDQLKDANDESSPLGLGHHSLSNNQSLISLGDDLATEALESSRQSREPSVDDEKMIHDATSYLHYIWAQTTNSPVETDNNDLLPVTGSVLSVISLGAWLLRGVNIGMSEPGGQILHRLYKRLQSRDNSNDFNSSTYLF